MCAGCPLDLRVLHAGRQRHVDAEETQQRQTAPPAVLLFAYFALSGSLCRLRDWPLSLHESREKVFGITLASPITLMFCYFVTRFSLFG